MDFSSEPARANCEVQQVVWFAIVLHAVDLVCFHILTQREEFHEVEVEDGLLHCSQAPLCSGKQARHRCRFYMWQRIAAKKKR